MAAVPTFPNFLPNDASLAKLQQLSAAVGFACRAPVIFHLYKTSNQSVSATTLTPVQWDAASADTDGGWTPAASARYTARTPGYFLCDWGVNCATTGVDSQWQLGLRTVSGPGNPNGSGIVTWRAVRCEDMGILSQQESLTGSGGSGYMYAGDYLEVIAFCTIATTITAGWNNSGNNDLNGFPDGSPSFTGMLVSLGP